MWKILYKSVCGTSHQKSDLPCQDSSIASELRLENELVILAACADGAGSAKFADQGSAVACSAILRVMADDLSSRSRLGQIDREQAVSWFRAARTAIQAQALEKDSEIREFACTLLVVIAGESGACFMQIGDGAIARFDGVQYHPVFWPQSGEYANTTNFLTHANFENHVEFEWVDSTIDEFAILTDGLQSVALEYAAKQIHQAFLAPMFRDLRSAGAADELEAPLYAFLESAKLNERTDDDKTLVLATRLPPVNQTFDPQILEATGTATHESDGSADLL